MNDARSPECMTWKATDPVRFHSNLGECGRIAFHQFPKLGFEGMCVQAVARKRKKAGLPSMSPAEISVGVFPRKMGSSPVVDTHLFRV